jgi:PadR family transcriptional regulator PadR
MSSDPIEAYLVKIERALVASALDILILDELSRTGPRHGYALNETLQARTGAKLREGAVYDFLRQAERLKLLKGRWELPRGGPPRRLFELTPQGKEVLLAEKKIARRALGALQNALGA